MMVLSTKSVRLGSHSTSSRTHGDDGGLVAGADQRRSGVTVMRTASVCLRVFFFFQAEDGIRDLTVTGVQTCALPICKTPRPSPHASNPAVAPISSKRNVKRRLPW